MKQNKRLLVLSMSLLLGLGMTACGNNNNSSSEPAKDSSSSVVEDSSSTTKESSSSTEESSSTTEESSSTTEESSSSTEESSSSTEDSSENDDEELNTLASDVADSIRLSNKDNKKRLESFTLPTVQFSFNKKDEKVTFTVTWTLTVEEGGFDGAVSMGEVNDKGMQVVNISYTENNNVQTNFTLVGTVSDGNGHDATVTLDGYYVPEYVVNYTSFEDFKKMADDKNNTEDATVLGTVSAIYVGSYPGIYITDASNDTFYCFSPAGIDSKDYAATFPIGSKVIATGTPSTYYGAYQFAKGCTLKKAADKAEYTIPYTDQTEAFTNAKSNKDSDSLNQYLSSYVELKNVKINDIDKANYYYYFTLGTNKYYLRTTTSFINPKTGVKFTGTEASSIVTEWVEGYTANIKGLVQSYSGLFYITPVEIDAVTIVAREISDESKMSNDINDVANLFEAKYAKASEVTLPANGSKYNSALTYEVTAGTTAKIENGKVIITPAAVEETVTIKVTATLNGKTVEDEITFTVLANQDLSKQVEINVDTVSMVTSYPKETEATGKIGDFEFAYLQVANFGNGMQFKAGSKDDTGTVTPVSYFRNATAFTKGIASIEVNLNSEKMTENRNDAFLFTFGTTNEYKDFTYSLSIKGDVASYVVTPDATTYTYFKMQNIVSNAGYITSIVVKFADGGETPVEDAVKFLPAEVFKDVVDSGNFPSYNDYKGTRTFNGYTLTFTDVLKNGYSSTVSSLICYQMKKSTGNFTITGKSISKLIIVFESSYEYNGGELSIKLDGNALSLPSIDDVKATKTTTGLMYKDKKGIEHEVFDYTIEISVNSTSEGVISIANASGYAQYLKSFSVK